MKAVKLCMLMMAALPVMAVASPAANPDAPALTPEAFDAVVASLPEPNPLGGFAVHSKQFCGSCHGPNGISQTSAWPHVAGQPFEVTAKALLDYRDGRRSGGERAKLMVAAVKTMTDQQIADVAAMYAMLPGPDGTKLEVGKKNMADTSGIDVSGLVRKGDPKRAITPCAACHGTTGKGRATGSPSFTAKTRPILRASSETTATEDARTTS